MKRKAVKRRPRPGYPTRHEVRLDPRLLAENLPWAWRGNVRLVQAAAALLALQAGGCGGERQLVAEPGRPALVGEVRNAGALAPVAVARVAPLFFHGEGRGATGCVVMNPPVFLSEEEALQIIVEELSRHGLDLDEREVVVDSVTITTLRMRLVVTKRDGSQEQRFLPDEAKPKPTALAMDLANRKKRVAVEFVGRSDFYSLGGVDGLAFALLDERTGERGLFSSSVREYNIHDVARHVRVEIERQGREPWHYGLFYDPVVIEQWEKAFDSVPDTAPSWERDKAFKNARKAAQKEAHDLLRAQVRDFAAWLKREGVI
ncbi:MAG: hypothetical protein JW940_23250 [Polyangiaceae bacterium]|nr:hypothetical protein [Polyangiaceae bacterium]